MSYRMMRCPSPTCSKGKIHRHWPASHSHVLLSFRHPVPSPTVMFPIARNLYLGDLSSVTLLPSHPSITATLSLLTPPHSSYPPLQVLPPTHTHLFIPISDTSSASLLSILPRALTFIRAHTTSSALLVHCFHGHSRSVATILAHLLTLSPSTAPPTARVAATLQALTLRYPPAAPSPYFLRQLAAFAEALPIAVYSFPPDHACRTVIGPLERIEILHCLRHAWPPAQPLDSPPWHTLLLPDPDHTDVSARCRKCRASLFARACFAADVASLAAKRVVQILPTRWVGKSVLESGGHSGRMRCVLCYAKVGTWNKPLEGVPRFEVTVSAVDFLVE